MQLPLDHAHPRRRFGGGGPHNADRKPKTMFTEREGGGLIRCFEAADDREEAQFVIRQILTRSRRDGRPHGDFAILYRSNAQSRSFEEELLRYDIPYTVVGSVSVAHPPTAKAPDSEEKAQTET